MIAVLRAGGHTMPCYGFRARTASARASSGTKSSRRKTEAEAGPGCMNCSLKAETHFLVITLMGLSSEVPVLWRRSFHFSRKRRRMRFSDLSLQYSCRRSSRPYLYLQGRPGPASDGALPAGWNKGLSAREGWRAYVCSMCIVCAVYGSVQFFRCLSLSRSGHCFLCLSGSGGCIRSIR